MRIFFSSYKYDYGKKDWGYSFEYINFYKTLKAMKNIDKVFFYPMDQINLYGKKKFNEKLYKIISNNKFDICFFFMFKDEFSSSFLKKIIHSSTDIIVFAVRFHLYILSFSSSFL